MYGITNYVVPCELDLYKSDMVQNFLFSLTANICYNKCV